MKVPSNIRKTALVAAVTLAITGIPTLDNDFNLQVGFSSVISSAYAAGNGQGQGGGQKAMGGHQGGQSEKGQGGERQKGGKSISDILAADEGEPGGSGQRGHEGGNSGKPGDTGSGKPSDSKGDSFGDLFVILRDENGDPVTEQGEF